MKKIKLLLYNWVQFDENDGGGVTVYLNNIINKLLEDDKVEIYFLSSGTKYSLLNNKIKIKKTKNKYGDKVKTYAIYNSPVMFSNNQFSRVDIYNNDKELLKVIDKFIEEENGFDIIHFNNLEGLSIEVLKLKEKYTKTKFIYSMHNYFPVCPNVYLWKHNKENCKDYCEGKSCCGCITSDYNFAKKMQRIKTVLSKLGINIYSNSIKKYYSKIIKNNTNNKIIQVEKTEKDYAKAQDYKIFREKNVKYINKYVDEILCVSKRVKEIAISMGIEEKKCNVSYIGTKFADNLQRQNIDINSKKFNLIYLGYMNVMKGFDFLIDSLLKLDNKITKDINLTLVCRNNLKYNIEEILKKLRNKYNSVTYIDGYTHDNLKKLLSNQHLGVIPVVWEDNLPQVSIEITSFGVPILSSDLGGASELSDNNDFKFKGSDTKDFLQKLTAIIKNRKKLDEYWHDYNEPTTMEKHLKELYGYYKIKGE